MTVSKRILAGCDPAALGMIQIGMELTRDERRLIVPMAVIDGIAAAAGPSPAEGRIRGDRDSHVRRILC